MKKKLKLQSIILLTGFMLISCLPAIGQIDVDYSENKKNDFNATNKKEPISSELTVPNLGKKKQGSVHEMITIKRLSKRVLLVRSGDMDMVAAIKTKKGIVIVDSGFSPTLTAKYRKIIEKIFGRSDIKFVINTHFDSDHVNGNQVFKGAEIIAHQNALEWKEEGDNVKVDIKTWVKSTRERIKRRKFLIKTLKNDSSLLYSRLRDWIYTREKVCDDFETIYKLALPSLTFTDKLTLDMGDLKIDLFYFGPGFHTDNDILVSIPEENIVFTGDILNPRYQYIPVNSKSDIEPWIDCLNKIIKSNREIKSVVAYHVGVLPGRALYEFHNSLKNMRDEQQQKKSAVDSLRSMISEFGIQKAAKIFENQYLINKNKEYFIWEGDLISFAREFQEKKQYNEAIIILKMCEKIFPNSVSVFNRLAYTFKKAGKKKLAIEAYKKALCLNPGGFYVDYIRQLESRE